MTQAFQFPSSTNGYMPQATQYVISYIRKKEAFAFNRYMQMAEAPTPAFWYYKLDRDESVRMRQLADHVWADGAHRFERTDIQQGFRQTQAFCVRYAFDTEIGNLALSLSDKQWKAKQVYLDLLASKCIIARTLNVWQGGPGGGVEGTTTSWGGLDTVSTWPTGSVANANDLNGGAGTWDKAGSDPSNPGNYMAIKKSIMAAVNTIYQQTNNRVTYKNLHLIISPNLARIMANTDEIRDQYKYGPFMPEMVDKGEENFNDRFGLPASYGGVKLIVEDAVWLNDLAVNAQTVGSTARAYIKADNKAVLVSRVGGIDTQIGPSASTVQWYWYKKQAVAKEFVDPIHEITRLGVEDFGCVVGAAMESGYMINNVI